MLAATLSAAAMLLAPFGEAPFRPADVPACLRATGTPGELVHSAEDGLEFLRASGAGLTSAGTLAGDSERGCPQVAARPNGAGVAALSTLDEPREGEPILASLREPGGSWAPMREVLRLPQLSNGRPLAVAASDRGDALIALAERAAGTRIVVTRRAPGGAFGPAEAIFTGRASGSSEITVQAGMSAAGEAIVAWAFRPGDSGPRQLWAAVAAPGAAFGAPARIGDVRLGSPFDLAVGSGGHALLAFPDEDEVMVAERAPGAAFGAPAALARAADALAVYPVVAVGDDARAVVGWHSEIDGWMRARVRPGPGAFRAATSVAPRVALGIPRGLLSLIAAFPVEDSENGVSAYGPDQDAADPRAEIAADGRALLTWGGVDRRAGLWWFPPRSATLPLAGGPAELHTHGSELRDVTSVAPLLLEGGGLAVAWTNRAESGDGRVHLAVEGAPDAPDPPAPRVRVGQPRKTVLAPDDAIELPVTCSAACDVRAHIGANLAGAQGTLSLRRAGRGTLPITPGLTAPSGRLRVRVRYGAPGARQAETRTVTVRVRRRPPPPLPRIVGVVARRDGDDVVVSWRTNRNADDEDFVVIATAGPSTTALGIGAARRGPRSWRARIGDVEPARYVSVFVTEDFLTVRRARVRIRG